MRLLTIYYYLALFNTPVSGAAAAYAHCFLLPSSTHTDNCVATIIDKIGRADVRDFWLS